MGDALVRIASVLEYDGLGDLLRYWQLAGRGGMPSRTDLDPADIPGLLSNVILIDVQRAPIRFRVRLCGTEVDRLLGRNFTGCYLDDMTASYFERDILLDYAEAVLHKRPKVARRSIMTPEGNWLRYQRLLLPLSSDGWDVDKLLGGVYGESSGDSVRGAA
ncbi:MAG: PAS domain-containing protein [Gammaproteobacteria bacterium]|jgi:hypothetical protein